MADIPGWFELLMEGDIEVTGAGGDGDVRLIHGIKVDGNDDDE